MLPEIKKIEIPSLTLPTAWQTVIFRNYGYVKTQNIAKVLNCDQRTVIAEAERLGLVDPKYYNDFENKGYITVIRNNWYLLDYNDLVTLLDINYERLEFILLNEDFLKIKLGDIKPQVDPVRYRPLTSAQIQKTQIIAETVKKFSQPAKVKPFDFFAFKNQSDRAIISANGKRIVHGYLSPCGDAFLTDCSDTLPNQLLKKYQQTGINGIWLHGLLSSLSPYPFAPELSKDYKTRRKNLNLLIDRCLKYGIKVYLYLNEPRALPENAKTEYCDLIGWKKHRTLCTQKEDVKNYLYSAVRSLCDEVPLLGGIFTITMSENATHCNFIPGTECPVCRNIPPEISASEVNNLMARAMNDSKCNGEFIANLWGWSPFMGWNDEQINRGISNLDKNIAVTCVSEYNLDIIKGGIKSQIIDYSISNPGPSEISRKTFEAAKKSGHKLFAKIQASNSWECSAVPYLPVFDLVYKHLKNLDEIGINDLFLTWTLGGYPSPSIEIAALYNKDFNLDEWYLNKYGEQGEGVHKGVTEFCKAFEELPFSIDMLYKSPKNLGPANLWDIKSEEKTSTMVCYSFDDYLSWITPYPYEVYTSQLKKLLKGWQRGIELIEGLQQTEKIAQLLRLAKAAFCHFNTDYLQTVFSKAKENGDKTLMKQMIDEEKLNAENLLKLIKQDAKIGFEASNHYLYTERDIIEKIIRMNIFSKLL